MQIFDWLSTQKISYVKKNERFIVIDLSLQEIVSKYIVKVFATGKFVYVSRGSGFSFIFSQIS